LKTKIISANDESSLESNVNEYLQELTRLRKEVVDIKFSTSINGDGQMDCIAREIYSAMIIHW